MAIVVLALETRDDDDMARVEMLENLLGRDVEDLRLGVHPVGDDAGLRAGQRNGLHAQPVQGQGGEGDGLLLAGGKENVELARGRVRVDLAGQLDQAIGDARHGRDHDDDPVALLVRGGDARGDIADALGAADGCAAIFLDKKRHGKALRYSGKWGS